MITLDQAFEAAGHALRNPKAQPIEAINHAGGILYSHPWTWRDRRVWTVSIGAGTEKVTLPADVADVRDVQPSSTDNWRYTFVNDYAVIQQAKAFTAGGCGQYLIAPLHEQNIDGEIVAKLAVYPALTTAAAQAVTVLGRGKWARVTGATDGKKALPLPQALPVFDTLYLELVRAYVRGYEFDEKMRVDDEIGSVMAGPIWHMALEADRLHFEKPVAVRNGWLTREVSRESVIVQYPVL